MCYMGDVLKRGHNRKITPLCTGFVHRSRDFTSSTAFYPTRGNAVAFGFKWGVLKYCHVIDLLLKKNRQLCLRVSFLVLKFIY